MTSSTQTEDIVTPSGRVFTSTLLDQIAEIVWKRLQTKASPKELLEMHFSDFPTGESLRDPILTNEKIAWYVTHGFSTRLARLLVRKDITPQFLIDATPAQIMFIDGIGRNKLTEILKARKLLTPQAWIKEQLLSISAQ